VPEPASLVASGDGVGDGDRERDGDTGGPRIVDIIWLSTLRGVHDLPDMAGLKCAFRLVGGEGAVRHLAASSKALKAGWLTGIRDALADGPALDRVVREAVGSVGEGWRAASSSRGSSAPSVAASTDGSAISRSGTDASDATSFSRSLSASGNRPISPPSSTGLPRRSALGAAAAALSMPHPTGGASGNADGDAGGGSTGGSGEGGVPALALPDRLADSWSVTLEGTEVRGVGQKQHAVYIVRLKASSGSAHKVFRRYSEFDTLHGLLRKSHAHCAARLPALPRKTFIASAMSGRVLESRQVALDSYLQALVANRDTIQLPLVRAFLELPGEDEGGWDSSFGATPRGGGSSVGSSITTPRAILTNLRPGGGRPSSPASPPGSTTGSSVTLRGGDRGGLGGDRGGSGIAASAPAGPELRGAPGSMVFKVLLRDNSVKTVVASARTTTAALCRAIAHKLRLPEEHALLYSLFVHSTQLQDEDRPADVMAAWAASSSDPVRLVYQRAQFLPSDTEPRAWKSLPTSCSVNERLLYMEARTGVVEGRYTLKEARTVLTFIVLAIVAEFGSLSEPPPDLRSVVARFVPKVWLKRDPLPVWVDRVSTDFAALVEVALAGALAVAPASSVSKTLASAGAGEVSAAASHAYLQHCRRMPVYGGRYFGPVDASTVREFPPAVLIVVRHDGVLILKDDDHSVVASWPFTLRNALSFASAPKSLTVTSSASHARSEWRFKTKDAFMIHSYIMQIQKHSQAQ
jgi:hypothetical protein